MKRALLLLVASATTVAAVGCSRPSSHGTAAAVPAAVPDPSYELRVGKQVWIRYCQTCHGENGAGDGFNAYNLDPHPRDLSDPAFQKKKSDADLREAVTRGGAGVGLSPLMPPWGRTLGRREIDQVILYVRTLRPPAS